MSEMIDWKDWNGGSCPVPPETEIQFQVKGESKEEASWWPYVRAGDCRWDHRRIMYSDLIAYRVHPDSALSQANSTTTNSQEQKP